MFVAILDTYTLFIWKCYHIIHFSSGFIGVPIGQLNTFENSSKLLNGPFTLYCDGACKSFSICNLRDSSVLEEHHTLNIINSYVPNKLNKFFLFTLKIIHTYLGKTNEKQLLSCQMDSR